jgi:hypothetical protein
MPRTRTEAKSFFMGYPFHVGLDAAPDLSATDGRHLLRRP